MSDKKARAVQAQKALYEVWAGDSAFIQANVRDGESVDEFDNQYSSRMTLDAEAFVRLSLARTQLANAECRLTRSPAPPTTSQ